MVSYRMWADCFVIQALFFSNSVAAEVLITMHGDVMWQNMHDWLIILAIIELFCAHMYIYTHTCVYPYIPVHEYTHRQWHVENALFDICKVCRVFFIIVRPLYTGEIK